MKRKLAVVLWQHLDDRAAAIALFGDVLAAEPTDSQTAQHLEVMWSEGMERVPLMHILEAHYRPLEDWGRLMAL
ncbi:MAG: hypothetical protein QF464_15385, partial [Myxococcota bacterium]|nr:hypothetical protein [Myxococcota bacterium]